MTSDYGTRRMKLLIMSIRIENNNNNSSGNNNNTPASKKYLLVLFALQQDAGFSLYSLWSLGSLLEDEGIRRIEVDAKLLTDSHQFDVAGHSSNIGFS